MGDEVNAGEDDEGGQEFRPGECVLGDEDGEGAGDDGLDVVVHAGAGRADAAYRHRDQQVGEEGRADEDVGHSGDGLRIGRHDEHAAGLKHGGDGERGDFQDGEEEHPLHHRDGLVSFRKRLGENEVERVDEAAAEDAEIAGEA